MAVKVTIHVPASRGTLNAALEGLVGVNECILRRWEYPRLYESGVRYEREQQGRERWRRVDEAMAAGVGDCADLAAWRAAELRVRRGEPARAIVYRSGKRRFHAVVQRADGSIEDPSRALGMGKKRSA